MEKIDSTRVLLRLYDEFRNSGKYKKDFPGIFEISLSKELGCDYVFDASICEFDGRDRLFMLGFIYGDRNLVKTDHAFVYGTMCSIQISQYYGKTKEECDCSKFDIGNLSDKRLRQIIFPIFKPNKDYLIGSVEGRLFIRDGISYKNHKFVPTDIPVETEFEDNKFYGEGSLEYLKTHVRKTISRVFQESELA